MAAGASGLRKAVTAAPWPERVDMLQGGIANGRMRELLEDDPEGRLTLGYALAQAEEVPPPAWVVQGGTRTLRWPSGG